MTRSWKANFYIKAGDFSLKFAKKRKNLDKLLKLLFASLYVFIT